MLLLKYLNCYSNPHWPLKVKISIHNNLTNNPRYSSGKKKTTTIISDPEADTSILPSKIIF